MNGRSVLSAATVTINVANAANAANNNTNIRARTYNSI